MLVSDYLGQADFRGKLGGAGTSPEGVLELRALARAIICVVMQLGGDYLPDSPSIPGDLVQRGQTIRTTIASALEKALPDDQELQIWLEAIRLGSGVVDLVYDLRTLADLCVQHGNSSAATKATAGAVQTALSAADAVEFALRTGDSAEIAQARHTLARSGRSSSRPTIRPPSPHARSPHAKDRIGSSPRSRSSPRIVVRAAGRSP